MERVELQHQGAKIKHLGRVVVAPSAAVARAVKTARAREGLVGVKELAA